MQSERQMRAFDTALRRPYTRVAHRGLGGAVGNARLSSLVGLVLLVGLAVEGATIPMIHRFLTLHIFVGMLLLGPVALKLCSTGYRFGRYYGRGREYVKLGPPAPLMRFLIAPVLVSSTIVLFGTGVVLLAVAHRGTVLLLHKASFIVWFGAMTIHVLTYTPRAARYVLADVGRRRADGRLLRVALALLALGVGVGVALATYRLGAPWVHMQR
jgi:hypothetical protein